MYEERRESSERQDHCGVKLSSIDKAHACLVRSREVPRQGGVKEIDNTVSRTYISGSFCISITAATGIPKFDAGPQKSAHKVSSSLPIPLLFPQQNVVCLVTSYAR
jgi:hypothetical protein